ncbi:hypothetical protein A9G34_04450 [Gilliamella sp. Choc4-2]|nr:hypothetical protein GAPWKB11_0285 [Gilliamella apicola]OCG32698.1 hypothetical protein A9G33_02655 [Gilliamella apicola]OCG46770.1 hypothetical protein A9G34_04450 [Gilliamella apicola]OCG56529.1 hypothetical protein A9G36_00475 [Gilliamella apicola]OCG62806.1 hypothetical protein A9G48_07165 [Gilliamella apicola]
MEVNAFFHVISSFEDFWALISLPLGLFIFLNSIILGLIIQRSGNDYFTSTSFIEQKKSHKIKLSFNEPYYYL